MLDTVPGSKGTKKENAKKEEETSYFFHVRSW